MQDPPRRKKPPENLGRRLYHQVPHWIDLNGAVFHTRIRALRESPTPLTEKTVAPELLNSTLYYAEKHRWWPHLFLLMPDHLHALLSFPPNQDMSKVIGNWKRYQSHQRNIQWQDNYFDHRLRNLSGKTGDAFDEKSAYIRNNPVASGLCTSPNDWPWWCSLTPDGEPIRGWTPTL